MDNQHKKISGYRDLSQEEIDLMNQIKSKEKELGELFQKLMAMSYTDKRSAALGRTNMEQGFMWLVRSVAKPASPWEQ